ncbi:hypothetical protein LTR12_013964 [Friedmanniomyces endolithicus]|nr:hypothetical protein LTR12_013964 [Friedmanniomyces endolithicus]
MEDSTAASLLDLSPELVVGILTTLDKPSQKRFRLVSNVCATLTAPLLFGHIYFDFDIGAISRQPKLCRHVHTIELRRRNGLRLFDDINAWRDATVYEYRPGMPGLDDGDVEMTADSMTQREWDMLTDDVIQRLYDAYESDRKAIAGHTTQLASALSAIVCDKHHRTRSDQGISGVHKIPTDFDGAIARLSHASLFVHDPGYMGDDWGIHWRTVQFHGYGILEGGTGDDEDIENIHLFAALRSIMLSTKTVTSVKLCTRSHAFWSTANLRSLLDWSGRTESRWSPVDAGLAQWVDDIGGPLTACQYIEAATRHLVLVESAFSRLTTLECWIDTVGADGSDELATIARALSSMLQRATDLQSLQLFFCDLAWCEQLQRPFYSNGQSGNSLPTRAQLTQLLSASAQLFSGIVRSETLQRLRRLELSLTTVETHLSSFLLQLRLLRHLTLRRVAFLPRQGLWEVLFQRISQNLQLESIELLAVEDVPNERPRLLLEPTASIWTNTGLERRCYSCYEDDVVRFVLRQATSLPPLDPEDFIRQHRQEFEPGHQVNVEAELDESTEEGRH